MKVLITGAAGQLGTDLAALCNRRGDEVVAMTRDDLDVSIAAEVRAALSAETPDVVFNCAAWTAVDACEDKPRRAQRINADAVEHLAQACEDLGSHLLQVSTDYVFDGQKPGAYVEDDPTNPLSVYGASKLTGETLAGDDATIVRTSRVCSAHGANMVATILRLANEHPTLRFVDDQHGRPTFTTDLAEAIRALAVERQAGTFHVANHGEVSWFEFAQQVLRTAGMDPSRVEPITTEDMPRPAPRPANSVLDTAKYEALDLTELRHFHEPLAEVVPVYLQS